MEQHCIFDYVQIQYAWLLDSWGGSWKWAFTAEAAAVVRGSRQWKQQHGPDWVQQAAMAAAACVQSRHASTPSLSGPALLSDDQQSHRQTAADGMAITCP